ncbi:MAG: permease-like cell division protein FtsX [Oscillospiraceae bacterium]
MKLHNMSYLVKQGVRSVFQNKLMSFSCIGVLVACMMMIGGSVLITASVNNIVTDVQGNTEIVVYLEQGTTNRQREEINASLNGIENISDINFISKEEHLEIMKARLGNNLLSGLEGSENTLPDYYTMKIVDTDLMEQTITRLSSISGIEKINAATEVASILSGIKQAVYYAGSGIVIILIVVSLAIITNTIKITVFSRRKEINIMKYVGATDSFIRLPFLVEGMLIGILAAIIAFLLLGVSYNYLLEWGAVNYGKSLSIVFNNAVSYQDMSLYLLAGFGAIGIVIGMLASGVFVRKHLRV